MKRPGVVLPRLEKKSKRGKGEKKDIRNKGTMRASGLSCLCKKGGALGLRK